MKISVVVPVFNESKNIVETISTINSFFKAEELEIIIVDDGSADNSVELIIECGYNNVKVLELGVNQGKGMAVKTGMLAAEGDLILLTDADLSVPIIEFIKLKQFISPETPIVIGSRGLNESNVNNSFIKVILGKIGNLFIQILIPGIQDSQCGFKLFLNKPAKRLFSRQKLKGFGFDFEILFLARKLNLGIKELPITWKSADRKSSVKFYHYFLTLAELFKVMFNALSGQYNLSKKTDFETAQSEVLPTNSHLVDS